MRKIDEDSKKEKMFKRIVESLHKEFSENVVSTLSNKIDITGRKKIGRIPSGIFSFDVATEGGWPRGRISEVSGAESTGKTLLLIESMVKAQKLGLLVAFVDVEHSSDPVYLKKMGVDFERLIFSQPEYGEQGLNVTRSLIRKKIDLIVVDSVAALTPKDEFDSNMDKDTMGLQARMMGKAMRKMNSKVEDNDIALVFINQTRDKIGVMFGDKTDTPGGKALKFFTSLRVTLKNIKTLKVANSTVGNRIRFKFKKCKIGPFAGREGEYEFIKGKGIKKKLDMWETLLRTGLAKTKTRQGKKRTYVGDIVFKDFDDFKEKIRNDKKTFKVLAKMLRSFKEEI